MIYVINDICVNDECCKCGVCVCDSVKHVSH